MPNLPISKEKQDLIQMLFQEGKSFKEIKNITKLNWRTIKKYANKPDKIYNSEKIKQIYTVAKLPQSINGEIAA
jgi:DNA invertase Pin-like site-specific DNA recombinase